MSLAHDIKLAGDAATAAAPELPGDLLVPHASWTTWSVGIGIGVLIVLVIAALVIRARRRAANAKPANATNDPAQGALERLRCLRDADPAAAHVELAAITRDYVTARFAIPAHERTSEELSAALERGADTTASALDALATVLAACDAVKFARTQPTADATARRIDAAREFVGGTRESA